MNIVYQVCSSFMRNIFSVLSRTTWHGLENLPKEGPVIVASNHVSFFDPPLVGCSATGFAQIVQSLQIGIIPMELLGRLYLPTLSTLFRAD